jgi:endonuclease YncB( thermonuclease family)
MTRSRNLRLFVSLATLAVACCCSLAAPHQTQPNDESRIEQPDFNQLQTGRVTRIVDENTLLIQIEGRNTRYDLLGLTTTALSKNQRELCADTLNRFLLTEHVYIQLDPLGEYTPANRRAAYIFRARDTLCINLELVRDGYARHADTAMSIHQDAFEHAQQRARSLKLGIWGPGLKPLTPEQLTESAPDTPESEPESTPKPKATISSTVYITPYGKKYHRKDCPHLTDAARPTTRQQCTDTHKPCKTCKPDTP